MSFYNYELANSKASPFYLTAYKTIWKSSFKSEYCTDMPFYLTAYKTILKFAFISKLAN